MRKILIIEDDQELAMNLRLLLEINGFEVFQANNGVEAMEIVQNHRPDVIVSDVRMPGMDGAEFLQQLRANELHRGIPFIFASAVVEPVAMRRLINLGADDFLPKPFSFYDLNCVIDVRLSRFSEISKSTKNIEWKYKDLLTSRELEIAKLVLQNLSAGEIADKLFCLTAHGGKPQVQNNAQAGSIPWQNTLFFLGGEHFLKTRLAICRSN